MHITCSKVVCLFVNDVQLKNDMRFKGTKDGRGSRPSQKVMLVSK